MYGTTDPISINFKYRNPKSKKYDWNRTTSERTWDWWAANPGSFISSVNWAAGYYDTILVE
jgi:hypothetical protein